MALNETFPSRRYRYSYSGSDIRAYAYYPGVEDELCLLESLATISVSVHEAKSQARALGYRGARGVSRGIRTVAGSIILTVIEDHPLRQLVSNVGSFVAREPAGWYGWSLDRSRLGTGTALNQFDFNNRISTLLPPFNIYMAYVSESSQFSQQNSPVTTSDIRYGEGPVSTVTPEQNFLGTLETLEIPGAAVLIEGIDIIDESIVASVNDVVTEMSFSFIARDYKPIAPMTFTQSDLTLPTEDEIKQDGFLKRLFGRKNKDPIAVFNAQQERDRQEIYRLGLGAGYSKEEIDQQLNAVGMRGLGG